MVGAAFTRYLADKILPDIKKKKLGFALFIFENNKPGTNNYISNCDRQDMITALEETLARFKNQEDFPTQEEN